MDEAPRLAEYYARRHYTYDDIDDDVQEENVRSEGAVIVWKDSCSLYGSRSRTNENCAAYEIPRCLETNPLGSSLVYCLESKVKGKLIPLWLVGSFFQYVPARIGRNAALDAAVSCLCDIYCSPYNLPSSIYQNYIKAVSSLRGCISDSSRQMESETLCASILLQMCEVSLIYAYSKVKRLRPTDLIKLIINVDRGRWSHLARGTTFLLHSRGVQRYTDSFDHAMLESQLSIAVCSLYILSTLLQGAHKVC